ncbi:MAG: pseudouridine synthase, partial [Bacteroidia bacterium]
RLGSKIIKKKTKFEYYALNKPIGIESTFNKNIKDNLTTVFPFGNGFFIAGRLDKNSEGLLLISNDGKWVNEMAMPESIKEKEYEVEVENEMEDDFINKMSEGVDIGFYKTKPCTVKKMHDKKFSIILTEGKNKQIKRMCKKLGNRVSALKRVRIDKFYLSDLHNVAHEKIEI